MAFKAEAKCRECGQITGMNPGEFNKRSIPVCPNANCLGRLDLLRNEDFKPIPYVAPKAGKTWNRFDADVVVAVAQRHHDGAAFGYTVRARGGGNQEVECGARHVGVRTTYLTQYDGIIASLMAARRAGVTRIVLHLNDSRLLNQLGEGWRVKQDAAKPLYARTMELLRSFEKWDVQRYKMSRSCRAKTLAKQAKPPVDHEGQRKMHADLAELDGLFAQRVG